jgi:predicted dehydrogenase
MKLRVGLIGLGDLWQSRHRPALKTLSDRFEVKAICCEVAHKSEQVAKEFNAIAIDGFRAMVERDDIDAVLSLAPDWAGPLPILAACDAGKAIYSAAAFDIALEQVKQIRDRVDKAGVAFMAELPFRHAPATLRLKELIATKLGQPRLLFCHLRMAVEEQTHRLRRGNHCPLTWRHLMEQVDWCSYLANEEPLSVTSVSHSYPGSVGIAFYQTLQIKFGDASDNDSKVLGQISIGHYTPGKWEDALNYRRPASIKVVCENGVAFVDLPSTLIWFDDAGQHNESLESERPVGEQMLTLFHRAVTSLIRKQSDLNDAYRAMKIVSAAIQSAKSGHSVKLEF